MRARELQLKARRGRMLVSGLAIVAVAGATAGILATRTNPRPHVSVQGPSTTTAPASTTTSSTTKPGVVATTTTTAPRAASSNAVSASWVSSRHGWVLEKNGRVGETTDGGITWKALGDIGIPTEFVHIRFADAARGFAFPANPNDNSQHLLETVDGGLHWAQLQTPFSSVSDLAISRGTVYAVGIPVTAASSNGPFPGFRIWSSPVSALSWSIDPLVLPTGAGPVPEQTFVFSGDRGWVVNNDRDVQRSARLDPATGHWIAWTPPCSGPASLAASTSSDLVLLCGPGFATSETASTIKFSHDGGVTFGSGTSPARRDVEGLLSPSPDAAVVAFGNTLQRTTDDGATWHKVTNVDSGNGLSDYGFTTPTQGFAIFNSGEMLMTYDAGATWSAVTLP